MKKTNIPKLLSFFVLFFIPIWTFAQTLNYFNTLITGVDTVVKSLAPLLVAIAVLIIVWGLVVFIAKADNEQEREIGKQRMVWGIIALFIIVSVWGFVALLQTFTGINGGMGTIIAPAIL